MDYLKNEKGYALIMVLAFILIVSIFAAPYLNTFIHDTREIEIETVKNQNNYLVESAAEITKAFVEANNTMTEVGLEEIINSVESNSADLLEEPIIASIDMENNVISFQTNDDFMKGRSNSKLSLTYRTFDITIFENNKIIISDKNSPNDFVKGNSKFRNAYDEQIDVMGISDDLFGYLIEEKKRLFKESFVESPYSPKLPDGEEDRGKRTIIDIENNITLDSLLVEGTATIRGKNGGGNDNPNVTVNGDVYAAGDLDISKLDRLTINGDLVVYAGDLHIINLKNLYVTGSIIVLGELKITGNPTIKASNISANDIHVNSDNEDIFN